MKVLLVGNGGREHAIARALVRTSTPEHPVELVVQAGNPALEQLGRSLTMDPLDPKDVVRRATSENVDLVVVGPEAPLVAGVADAVLDYGIPVFGPTKDAARLEASKSFAKQVMADAGVATARAFTCTTMDEVEAAFDDLGAPYVVKDDALAAGKGVIVAQTTEEALVGVHECFTDFGAAGSTVMVEEMLDGPECSLLALTDGTTVVPLATSQDHKRALDGDRGPNTGGMGVYSPVPILLPDELEQMVRIERQVVGQLRADGIIYQGCLYGGFMLTKDGPKVLEFNARFGDPETQVVLPRMKADLVECFLACDDGSLDEAMVRWEDDWAVSVVLASKGYPGHYEKGKPISGIADANAMEGVFVYHAGTTLDDEGDVLTNGGRVLDVTAIAPSFEEARNKAYQACDRISFEGKTYRHDIGIKAIKGRANL